MSVTTVSLTQPQNASGGKSTASIRAWGSSISSLFSGAGLVKTSDTGQVDWTTYTFSGFSSNSVNVIGYEVWKFNDSLQATKPVFLRVEYLNSNTIQPSDNFWVRITVCTSTDGAGTAAGITYTCFVTSDARASSSDIGFTGAVAAFSSGDGSYLTLVLGPPSGTSPGEGLFYIDRTRDSSGAITGEGVCFSACGAGTRAVFSTGSSPQSNSGTFVVFNFAAATATQLGGSGSSNGVLLPANVYDSMTHGTTIGLQAPAQVVNGKLLPPILAAVAYYKSDISAGSTVTVSVSGALHTYYCLGDFATCADRNPGNTNAALAVRYE